MDKRKYGSDGKSWRQSSNEENSYSSKSFFGSNDKGDKGQSSSGNNYGQSFNSGDKEQSSSNSYFGQSSYGGFKAETLRKSDNGQFDRVLESMFKDEMDRERRLSSDSHRTIDPPGNGAMGTASSSTPKGRAITKKFH